MTEDFHNKAAKAAKADHFGYEVADFGIKPLWPLRPCCEPFCFFRLGDDWSRVRKDGSGLNPRENERSSLAVVQRSQRLGMATDYYFILSTAQHESPDAVQSGE
jgi:hypothetical protein